LNSRIARHAAAAAVAVGVSIASARSGGADVSSAAGSFETKKACVGWHEQAQILRRASSLIEARADLLACSQDVCPVAVRSDCAEWLSDVGGAIPSVVIRARSAALDESNVRVFVDATLATSHLDGRAVELDPGIHTFRFEADGESPVEERVLVVEGEKNRILTVPFGVPFGAAGPAPSGTGAAGPNGSAAPGAPAARPIPMLDYAFAAGAVVAAGVSAGFGVWGLDEKSSLDSSCRPVCTSSQIASVRTKLVVADALLGVALVSAGAAVYVYVTRPEIALPAAPAAAARGARPWARVTMGGGASGPSLGLEGAF
jgi:hypothetical protein